jgi:hypothetical protein
LLITKPTRVRIRNPYFVSTGGSMKNLSPIREFGQV